MSSEYSTFLLLQDVFRRHELTLPDSTFTERIGKKMNVFVDEILGETVSDVTKKKILDDFYEEFLGNSQKYAAPIEATVDFIRGYRGVCILSIASVGGRGSIVSLLKSMGLDNKFQHIISSEDVTHLKPHPEIYQVAMKHAKVEPADCIVIEDSVVGVEAAYSAGCKVYVLLNGINKREDFDLEKVAGFLHTVQDLERVSA